MWHAAKDREQWSRAPKCQAKMSSTVLQPVAQMPQNAPGARLAQLIVFEAPQCEEVWGNFRSTTHARHAA